MKILKYSASEKGLHELCENVRKSVLAGDYHKCEESVREAMRQYPHSPEPHNLLGILLEKGGEHMLAMRHFRAAWALDPTYLPARQNLDTFGTFSVHSKCAFDLSDCVTESDGCFSMEYSYNGVGRVVRRI